MSEEIPPTARAQLARAWCEVEDTKRILKMRPKPKDVDVEKLKELPTSIIGAQRLQPAVANAEQTDIFQVGLHDAPTAPQIFVNAYQRIPALRVCARAFFRSQRRTQQFSRRAFRRLVGFWPIWWAVGRPLALAEAQALPRPT